MPRRWVTFQDHYKLPTTAGCYAVYLDDKLVYIGQAINLRRRFMNGHKFRQWRYSLSVSTPWGDGIALVKVAPERLFGERLTLESRLIKRLRPRFNKQGVGFV